MPAKKPGKGKPEKPKRPRRPTGETRATRMASSLDSFISQEWDRILRDARQAGKLSPAVERLVGRTFAKYMRFVEEGLYGKSFIQRRESAVTKAKKIMPERILLAETLGQNKLDEFDRNRIAEKMALTFRVPGENKEEFKLYVENYVLGIQQHIGGRKEPAKAKFFPAKYQLMRLANELYLGGRKLFAFKDLEEKMQVDIARLYGEYNLAGLEKRFAKAAKSASAFPHSQAMGSLKARMVGKALKPFKAGAERELIGDVLEQYFDAVSQKKYTALPQLHKALNKLGFGLFRQQFVVDMLPQLYAIKKMGADYNYYISPKFREMEWLVDQKSGAIETERELARLYKHYFKQVKAGEGLTYDLLERMKDFKLSPTDPVTKEFIRSAKAFGVMPKKLPRKRLYSLPNALDEIIEKAVSREVLSEGLSLKEGFTPSRIMTPLKNYMKSVASIDPKKMARLSGVLKRAGLHPVELKRITRQIFVAVHGARVLDRNLAFYRSTMGGKLIKPQKPDVEKQLEKLRERISKTIDDYIDELQKGEMLTLGIIEAPILLRNLVKLKIDSRELDALIKKLKLEK